MSSTFFNYLFPHKCKIVKNLWQTDINHILCQTSSITHYPTEIYELDYEENSSRVPIEKISLRNV